VDPEGSDGVQLSDLAELAQDRSVKCVYGEPYETSDGTTVIPVARIRAGRPMWNRGSDRGSDLGGGDTEDTDSGGGFGLSAAPVGVFVVHGGKASWVPAVDASRVALISVTTGLLAATITCLALLRQPPWPRITITEHR
jgi:uncharacterized spore protein YtfJ